MNVGERNEWLMANDEAITKCVKRYCDRNNLGFDDLKQDVVEFLILYLDYHGEPNRSISNIVGNYIRNYIRREECKIKEELHYMFEYLWWPEYDFEAGVVVGEILAAAKLEDEDAAFMYDALVYGYSFKSLGEKWGLTKEGARQKYRKLMTRLRSARYKLCVSEF